jgi:hypothetical protein
MITSLSSMNRAPAAEVNLQTASIDFPASNLLGRPCSEPTLFIFAHGYQQISRNRTPLASVCALAREHFNY